MFEYCCSTIGCTAGMGEYQEATVGKLGYIGKSLDGQDTHFAMCSLLKHKRAHIQASCFCMAKHISSRCGAEYGNTQTLAVSDNTVFKITLYLDLGPAQCGVGLFGYTLELSTVNWISGPWLVVEPACMKVEM